MGTGGSEREKSGPGSAVWFGKCPRYVGHSLYRGYTTVRITSHPTYQPFVPVVGRIVLER
jgi:hypothetical protein